jgi:Ser/Thr protein kinase RdoA (MazF antagonist)
MNIKDHLGKIYGKDFHSCRFLIRNVSDVYLLEDESDKYIFKIYRNSYRKLYEINGEVQLLNILKERGAPVSYAIEDLSGNQVQTFQAAEGIRNGVLFSFAKGKVVPNPDDEQLKILGGNLALIHDITAGCELDYERITYDI